MSRRLVVVVALLAAAVLAFAPVSCSESSEGDGASCKTVFDYKTPLG